MFSTKKFKFLLALASLALISLLLSGAQATRQPAAPHHRHRHRHELQRVPSRKRDDNEKDYYSDNEDDDYQEDELYSDESEENKDNRPSRHRNAHARYEPRYPTSRYHRRHHGSAPRRAHGYHRARLPAHHRRRYDDEDTSLVDYQDEDVLDNETYDRFDKHKRKRTNRSRSRYEPRKDWRYRNSDEEDTYEDGYDSDYEDDEPPEYGYRARKHDRSRKGRLVPLRDQEAEPSRGLSSGEWAKKIRQLSNGSRLSHESSSSKKRMSTHEPENEEDALEQLWKDDNVDDDEDDEAEELDNDFYKNDDNSPLKTYDDIIRRLTEDRATSTTSTTTSTPKPTKRNYRNIELESHLRRDAYGNLRFIDSSHRNVSYRANIVLDHDGKKKESDYEDTQADANTDYLEDENDEDESSSPEPSTTSTTPNSPMTASMSTTTSTTTTTTTTPRPVITNRYERKEAPSTGSQYNGYQEKNEYPPMSSHSALKWQQLGTREAVKETRNTMLHFGKLSRSAEAFAARSHIQRVQTEGSCQWPRMKVIPVREIYANSTLVYNPHCAMLHRCSDDTGCCRSEAYTCEAKHVERVELYFYTTSINGKMEIEKLSFDNHTECECRERKDQISSEFRVARHYNPSAPAPQNISRPPTKRPCRCPTRFNARITIDGVCECGCLEKDDSCTKLQRGKGYLSVMDRLCITREQCTAPNCTFGQYNITAGKCPQKKDIFESTPNYRSNFNYYQRRS